MPFLIWYRKMNFFHDIVIEKTSRVCHDWRWKEYTNREQLHMGTCLKSVALTVPPSLIGISYLFPVRLSTTVRESRFFSADAKVWNRSKVPWGETVESWRWAASTANLLRWGDEEDNDDNDDDDEEEEEEEEDGTYQGYGESSSTLGMAALNIKEYNSKWMVIYTASTNNNFTLYNIVWYLQMLTFVS